MKALLKQILQQAKEEEGLFKSDRFHPIFRYSRNDNNIFFTANILLTLNRWQSKMSPNEAELVDQINEVCKDAPKPFENKEGLPFYNFYTLRPEAHFPGSLFLSKFKYFKLADDLDDTALVLAGFPGLKPKTEKFHRAIPDHTNYGKAVIKHPIPGAKNLKTYSTWLGSRMPIEFDVSVLCNYLYMLNGTSIHRNKHDEDAVELIRLVIKNRWHLRNPHRVSPEYPCSVLIVYHIARLISQYNIPRLIDCKTALLKDIQSMRTKANPMQQLVLSNASMMLGKPMPLDITPDLQNTYGFCTASFLNVFKHPIFQGVASTKLFHMQFNCSAWNKTLYVEHEILKSQF